MERYYHAIAPFYSQELATRGDVDFWRAIARERAPARILELGAGAGRITEPLAASPSRVVALDLSREMLRIARQTLAGRENICFIRGDMRELPFGRAFDLVVAADDPFSHLTSGRDREMALRAAARTLQPDGVLILDALWFSPRIRRRMASRHGHHIARDAGTFAGRMMRVTERWRSLGRLGLCRARYEYTLDDVVAASATFQARAWSMAELRMRLASNG
ncbi:MAG: class I SAM-dependent methyltransferase, partial [Gemmatimonadaceae bacterium]